MSRDYKVYLEDISEAIQNIQDYVDAMTYEQFSQDKMRQHAVFHNLQNIGEAAKHIPEAIKLKYTVIDWRRISGLRDIIAHDYFGIKLEGSWAKVVR